MPFTLISCLGWSAATRVPTPPFSRSRETAEGHLFVPLPIWLRIVLALGAIGLVTPNHVLDLVGAIVALAALGAAMFMAKRQERLHWREI